jgi:hypothetical protein
MNSLEFLARLRRIAAAIIVCNPLLLLSPMCLLYGIYRAVTTPNLFAGDTGNTIFNFIALALYVLAVCVTSTLLARKRIIPDATMLLLLHALLFVAPFILIAHGVFLGGDLAAALGWMGMGFGFAQLWMLRRLLPDSFMSKQLVIGGALTLAANFAAPMIFRSGLENVRNDNEVWGTVSTYAWNLVLPLLAAWLNALPSRANGAPIWARSWFAFAIYILWMAGTTVQLWTVAYVDDRSLRASQFTAVAWVHTWTLFRRASEFPAILRKFIEPLAPGAVLLIPALGALLGLDLNIAATLFVLNVPLAILMIGRTPALAITGLSFAAAACCMPVEWMQWIVPQTDRLNFTTAIVAGLSVGILGVLRDSRAGIAGAIGTYFYLAPFPEYSGLISFNAAILFLFVHHLVWGRIQSKESVALFVAGTAWMIYTLAHEARGENTRFACIVATIVTTAALRNASMGLPTSLIPPVCSIFVLLIHPIHVSSSAVAKAPSGVLAIVVGFLLLGAGAWNSLLRERRAVQRAVEARD